MSDAAAAMMTIRTESPDAGARALRGALLCLMIVIAVAIGDVWWVGLAAAIDINSRAFNPLPLFVAVCAAVLGGVALTSGVLHTLRFRKFGSSELFVGEPRLGEDLRGVVRTSQDLAPLSAFKVRLRCDLHTSTRNSRGGGSTGTTCLWESVQVVPATSSSSNGIPVHIAIPGNGLVSGPRKHQSGADQRVSWALEIVAPLGGLRYYAEFAIPMKERRSDGEERVPAAALPSRTHAGGSRPFAGCDAPRSDRWKWLLRALVMIGSAITVAGTFGIADQLRSQRVSGHVTALHGGTLDVAIDHSGSAPVTAHVTRLPDRGQRERGSSLTLICGEVKADTYSCDPDTGLRWWIQTGSLMSIGVGMLLVAWLLWRRRRWWA